MVGTSIMEELTKLTSGDLVCTEMSSYLFSEQENESRNTDGF